MIVTYKSLLQVLKEVMSTDEPSTSKEMVTPASEPTTSEEERIAPEPEPTHPGCDEKSSSPVPDIPQDPSPIESVVPPACVSCAQLLKDNRKLSNSVKTLREIVAKRRKEAKMYRRKSKNKVILSFI